jgi:hypothetical protein
MEPGPPAEEAAGTDEELPQEPNTESFLAALLVDDAQVVVDSVTGKAMVSKRDAAVDDSGDGEASKKIRP